MVVPSLLRLILPLDDKKEINASKEQSIYNKHVYIKNILKQDESNGHYYKLQ